MSIIRTLFMTGLLLLTCASAVFAQAERAAPREEAPAPTVTVSVSAKGVRFVALGSVKQVRLEVFDAAGTPVYNSDFQLGNVRDWKLEDKQGQRLADGTYTCVVTFRDLSGRMGIKQGAVLVESGRAALELGGGEQAGTMEAEKSLVPTTRGEATAVTLTAHDGGDGQLVSTRGGLSFRAGDFFAGQEKELMRLTPEGDLGVGVAEPRAKLDVAGTILARGGIRFNDGTTLTTAPTASSAPADQPTANAAGTGTTNRLPKWLETGGAGTLGDSSVFESGGLVGVGTSVPEGTLHIQTPNTTVFKVVSTGTVATGRAIFQMYRGAAASANGWDFGYNTDLSSQGFIIRELTNGAPVTRFSIGKSTGFVGIGIASPQSRLHVAGDMKVTGNAVVDGNIAAKYQDVAEWVPARREIAAGTVVILDPTQNNAVRPSQRAYDTHVAGVVSAQPGVILGEGGAGKVLVATTGRVKVRVDARRGAVRIGDLLVTSGREGVAMRSRPVRAGGALLHRPGTIIGKALEPLAKGESEILVLLSMQ